MVLRSWWCSSVNPKSIGFTGRAGLNDFFALRIPANRAAFAIAVHGHTAGDGNAIAQLQGAVRLASQAYAVEEILQMGLRNVGRTANGLLQVRSIHFLRHVAHLAGAGDRSVRAQDVFGDSQLIVSQTRNPTDQ